MLPIACGATVVISQGNAPQPAGWSHNDQMAKFGFDFSIGSNTPLYAIEDGIVSKVRNDIQPGAYCYAAWSATGDPNCANTLNYVVIEHADGADSASLHINKALVPPGQQVRRGDKVALSGGTGWATGPHAHVQRQTRCGSWWCQSLWTSFDDVPGGTPVTGQTLTSQNCP
jgi:murein DD-endopeptidase MepM/ murein hydrolase activator NlpD